MKRVLFSAVALSLSMLPVASLSAEGNNAAALAKKLANPIAAMISVPFQGNYDTNIGANDSGSKYYINVQPVIPISVNDEWNLITRTIVPVVW